MIKMKCWWRLARRILEFYQLAMNETNQNESIRRK